MDIDPLQEVRSIRRQISTECGDDAEKILEYYLRHQEESLRSGKYRFVDALFAKVPAGRSPKQNDTCEPDLPN